MLEGLMGSCCPATSDLLLGGFFGTTRSYVLVLIGFSLVIFIHELGHFLAAKWCGVRVDKFAIGFGRPVFSWRRGIGLRGGSSQEESRRRLEQQVERKRQKEVQFQERTAPTDAELARAAEEINLGETEYCFNWLPLGGYVKMLGQEDFEIDKSGEMMVKDDPRSFPHKSIAQRMLIVSSGVVMNVVLAAVLFMIVFMIGMNAMPAVIGTIVGESPAARAGLEPGDRIVEINGHNIADFKDLQMAVVLADPGTPMNLVYERHDPQTGALTRNDVRIQPTLDEERSVLQLGVSPRLNNIISGLLPDPSLPADEQLLVGDEILEVSGRPVSDLLQILLALAKEKGAYCTLKVRRTLQDGSVQVREVRRRAPRLLLPTGDDEHTRQSGHVLGFVPRIRISDVDPGGRADLAGIRDGDVIVRWGEQLAPTLREIYDSIASHKDRDIRVEVLRHAPGQQPRPVQIVVRPEAQGVLGWGPPRVGMAIDQQEEGLPVVADLVTTVRDDIKTPAAKLKELMPRGSLITAINGKPVADWGTIISQFTRLAGTDVNLAWRTPGGVSQSDSIHVPQTLGTTFDLPGDHMISSIDGKSFIDITKDGRSTQLAASNWRGASKLLEECIGRTIEVQHRSPLESEPQTVRVHVTPEMLDTWVLRILYYKPDIATMPILEKIRVRNPLAAMSLGVRKTYYFIEDVYLMIQRMVIDRSVGFDQVSGPIGIVKAGTEIARQDLVNLLYFLALISANLAVINFLPLPIFDGGLMVFLMVEKIKGSPIPVKVQIVTQLVGLALIITIFVYVTIQDVQRWFG
jgi:RIP metalloprotease RseP